VPVTTAWIRSSSTSGDGVVALRPQGRVVEAEAGRGLADLHRRLQDVRAVHRPELFDGRPACGRVRLDPLRDIASGHFVWVDLNHGNDPAERGRRRQFPGGNGTRGAKVICPDRRMPSGAWLAGGTCGHDAT